MDSTRVGELLRELAPQVLGALLRKHRDFDACEDALQEAMLAASVRWPADGLPDNPRAWLITVGSRRVIDQVRSDVARRDRETISASRELPEASIVPGPGESDPGDHDDTLMLFFLCCHPALTPASQVALTLRAVGGLTTAEIAAAFLVPEATVGPRISRAKKRLRAAGAFSRAAAGKDGPAAGKDGPAAGKDGPAAGKDGPAAGKDGSAAANDGPVSGDGGGHADRIETVRQVLYLIFNEGYTASSGPDLQRPDLAAEAIRLTRVLHRALPADGEVAGLLALMLLTDARRAARTGDDGGLVPLADQDRTRWDRALIDEGDRLVTGAMKRSALGPYQLQAAIAALHVQAAGVADTDWKQIRFLYRVLCRIAPTPMATLNHAIAVAMVDGPEAGLAMVAELAADPRMARHHRLAATRAHLRELAGETAAARADYLLAAKLTTSLPEQRYLRMRAERLAS